MSVVSGADRLSGSGMIPDPIQRLDDPPEPTADEWNEIEAVARGQDTNATTSCSRRHGGTMDMLNRVEMDVLTLKVAAKHRKPVTK